MSRHPSQSRQKLRSREMCISYLGDDTYDHSAREAEVERKRVLDTLHLFGGQGNVQRRDVLLKLFDFPATNDWEHVGDLMQMVRNSNCK
jgi:hypothetical protein